MKLWGRSVLAVVFVLIGCTHLRVVNISDSQPPPELSRVLEVWTQRGDAPVMSGHGYAMGMLLHTVAHIIPENYADITTYWRTQSGRMGMATIVGVDRELDHATLRFGTIDSAPRLNQGPKPALSARLWYVGFMANSPKNLSERKPVFYCGRFMGMASKEDGTFMVDGAGTAGISGSPVLDDFGRVVGMVTKVGHQDPTVNAFRCVEDMEKTPCCVEDMEKTPCWYQFMVFLTYYRSMVWARPLWMGS